MKQSGKIRLLVLLCGICLILGGCKKKQESEAIPITTVSQSIVEEDPEDTFDEDSLEYEVELPENPDSFAFALWSETYELPLTYGDFTASGWEYEGNPEEILAAQNSYEEQSFFLNGNGVIVTLFNPDTVDKAVSKCSIGAITVDTHTIEGQGVAMTLPGNIILQKSLLSDVINLYGEPMDRYEDENGSQLTYEFGLYQSICLYFENDTDLLYRADLVNILLDVEQEDLSKVSDAETEEVKEYREPEEESTEAKEYIISYDQALYRLPAPVSAFVKNGWTVDEQQSDAALAANTYGSVTLEKDGIRIYGTVHNMGSEVTTIRNCFLTILCGDLDTTKVQIKAAGVTLGMSEDDMCSLLYGQKYEKEEDPENELILYTIYTDDSRLNYMEFRVDSVLHLVRGIQVVNNEIPMPDSENAAGTTDSPENADGSGIAGGEKEGEKTNE